MSPRNERRVIPPDFSLDHEGEPLAFSKYISKEAGRLDTIVVERFDFSVCPVCLEPDPTVAEHVPPESLGGRVMTLTCQPCNNDFGTAEEQLRSFIDLETTVRAQTSDGTVRGRRAATVAFRSSEGRPPGAFVRSAAPEFDDVLQSGSSSITVEPLDMPLVVAAGLKQAYLAACLHQQAVPETDDVARVRDVLLAARNRERNALMAALTSLGFEAAFGWVEGAGAPPVLLLETDEEDPHWVLLFGGRYVLQWPFADVVPRAAGHVPPA